MTVPQDSPSAKTLTTEPFRCQAAEPALSRSEALNRTMVDMIDGAGFRERQNGIQLCTPDLLGSVQFSGGPRLKTCNLL